MARAPLTRPLGFVSLLALGINGIVGVGIFFAPSEVAAQVPGRLGLSVYVLTALALMPVAWTYATLGGRFDRDGGPYLWARAAFGPIVGFGVGWITYVSAVLSTSAVIAGVSQHFASLLGFRGGLGQQGCAIIMVGALSGLVALGLKPSAIAWNVITLLKLAPLVMLVLAFLLSGQSTGSPPTGPTGPAGLAEFGRATLVVLFAMQGFEIVPVPAGSTRGARRAVPAATLGALGFAAALYVLLHAACVRALPGLSQSSAPIMEAAVVLGGSRLGWVVGVGTSVSALGIAFGMLAMGPRYLAVLGTHAALGPWLGQEDRRQVPQRALWLNSACVGLLAASGKLSELFTLSSVAVLAQYGVSAAALVALAAKRACGLDRRHLWSAPLAIIAIVIVGQGARLRELAALAIALAVGGALLLIKRRGTPAGGDVV